jgi:hypothetical protein
LLLFKNPVLSLENVKLPVSPHQNFTAVLDMQSDFQSEFSEKRCKGIQPSGNISFITSRPDILKKPSLQFVGLARLHQW